MEYNKLIEENKKLKAELNLIKNVTKTYDAYKISSKDYLKDYPIIIAGAEYFDCGYFVNKFVSKEEIKYCLTKLNGAIGHFEKRRDNNVIMRVKSMLEDLIKED